MVKLTYTKRLLCREKRAGAVKPEKLFISGHRLKSVFVSFNVTLLGGISLSLITACAPCLDGLTGCPAPALQGPF